MIKTEKNGKIFFIKTNPGKEEKFGQLHEINSNFDLISSIAVNTKNAIGLTNNEEVLEWKNDKIGKKKKCDFSFLLGKPIYKFVKMKFRKILLNKNGNILVWGSHKDGLLGLGYNVTSVENPTKLESLKNIVEISISENHAVVIDNNGEAFSWGNGKYGELGLERQIFSPFPTKIKSQRIYTKVFCSELLTCFIDLNQNFSYFGVIIKIFKGSNSSITFKSLQKDESNQDPIHLFQERIVYELESEMFTNIAIGNGFIGLLSQKGLVYTLDHSDNITILYSKYFVYSISVSNNQLYGICKDNNKINFQSLHQTQNNLCENVKNNNKNENILKKSFSEQNILKKLNNLETNYFLCRWIASFSEKDVISDSWTTHLYKISEYELENFSLIDSKNTEVLIFIQNENKESSHRTLNSSHNLLLSPQHQTLKHKFSYREEDTNNDEKRFLQENSYNTISTNRHPDDGAYFNLKKSKTNLIDFLNFISTFDDSYNMKYKRTKHLVGIKPLSSNHKNKVIEKFASLNLANSTLYKKIDFDENVNNNIEKITIASDISNNETINLKSNFEDNNNNTLIINNIENFKNNTHQFGINFNNTENSINNSYRKNNTMLLKSFKEKQKELLKIDFLNEEENNLVDLNLNSESSKYKDNLYSPQSESIVQFYSESAGFSKINKSNIKNNFESSFNNSDINLISQNNYERETLTMPNTKSLVPNSLMDENESPIHSPSRFKEKNENLILNQIFFTNKTLSDSEFSYKRKKTPSETKFSELSNYRCNNMSPVYNNSPDYVYRHQKSASQNIFQNNYKNSLDVDEEINDEDEHNNNKKIEIIKINSTEKINHLKYTFNEEGISKFNNFILPLENSEVNQINNESDPTVSPHSSSKASSYFKSTGNIFISSPSNFNKNKYSEFIKLNSLNIEDINSVNFTSSILKRVSDLSYNTTTFFTILNKLILKNYFEIFKENNIEEEQYNFPIKYNLKEFQYFSKILIKNISIFYKENKHKILQNVFNHLNKFSIEKIKFILLVKLFHKLKKKNYEKSFNKWKKIDYYSTSVELLHSIYLKHLNYVFSFFKHYTKVFNLKKKYFEVFIGGIERTINKKMKKEFLNLFIRKMYFNKNYKNINKNVNRLVNVLQLNLKIKGFFNMRKFDSCRKLLLNNFIFLSDIIKRKYLDLKRKFLNGMIIKIAQKELLKYLVIKKHATRIFLLKKSFRNLKKFSLRENENLYLNLKLKKVLKIFFYKQRMNLLKMLFKWNNNATKKTKPKLERYNNFKVNDFKNKLRLSKVPGINNFLSKNEKVDLFIQNIHKYLNKNLHSSKLNFLQKIYTIFINEKIKDLCKITKNIIIGKIFKELKQKVISRKIKSVRVVGKEKFKLNLDLNNYDNTANNSYKNILIVDNINSYPNSNTNNIFFDSLERTDEFSQTENISELSNSSRKKLMDLPDSLEVDHNYKQKQFNNNKKKNKNKINNLSNSGSSISIEQNSVNPVKIKNVKNLKQIYENSNYNIIPKIELKNINLPLSSSFNNLYITPKFRTYRYDENSNQKENYLNSENKNESETNENDNNSNNINPIISGDYKIFTIGDATLQTSLNLRNSNEKLEKELHKIKTIDSQNIIKNKSQFSDIFHLFKNIKSEKNDTNNNSHFKTTSNFFSSNKNNSKGSRNSSLIQEISLKNKNSDLHQSKNSELHQNKNSYSIINTISKNKIKIKKLYISNSLSKSDAKLNSYKNCSAAYEKFLKNILTFDEFSNSYYHNQNNIIYLNSTLMNVILNRKYEFGIKMINFLKRKSFLSKNKEKIYATKMIFRVIKRRIYFFKLKFLHRCKLY